MFTGRNSLYYCFFALLMYGHAHADILGADILRVEKRIHYRMQEGKIPGLSIVVIKDGEIYYKNNFGFADLNERIKTTNETLYEIGSNTKAFTALAIYSLANKKKIDINKPISFYIPWLKFKYEGKDVDVKIRDFLFHTSGLPYSTIAKIPVSSKENALEITVRRLVGEELDFYPGEKHSYATVNYDVLGLLIEIVSNQSYADFMKQILGDLDLPNTYIGQESISGKEKMSMATGYKLGFTMPREYTSPRYQGNNPAAYIVSNIDDMEKWLLLNLGVIESPYHGLIKQTHVPNRRAPPSGDGGTYAGGWYNYQINAGEFMHGGLNPNFSSFIIFRPEEKFGIAVLSNISTSHARALALEIRNILLNHGEKEEINDFVRKIDNLSTTVFVVGICFILVTIINLCSAVSDLFSGKRKLISGRAKIIVIFSSSLLFLLCLLYGLYLVPYTFFGKVTWDFSLVWAPISLPYAVAVAALSLILFMAHVLLVFLTRKPDEKSVFDITALSVFSGAANALLVFTIIDALNREHPVEDGVIYYYLIGIFGYIFSQAIARIKLARLVSDYIFNKRMSIIKRIMASSFSKVENIKKEDMLTTLNNDTQAIGELPNIIVRFTTNMVTLVICFIYMGIVNSFALVATMIVIALAVSLYMLSGSYVRKHWEKRRDIEAKYIGFINGLKAGFKELYLNKARKKEYYLDIKECCDVHRIKTREGEFAITGSFITGELLFTIVIGFVVFVFALIFEDMGKRDIMIFTLILLYITGPINVALGMFPQIIHARISLERIKSFRNALRNIKGDNKKQNEWKAGSDINSVSNLVIENVEFRYENGPNSFSIGPVSFRVSAGETLFITGGNGSGKTTLIKVISGLYSRSGGRILVNGNVVSASKLSQMYASVFSEYHLFEYLYGIDHQEKRELINEYLSILELEGKISLEKGRFNTLNLSSGQRKRLALMVAMLEDRPIYLFDEWAADQDPAYKDIFYKQLLRDLKKRNKCVIVVTHDDRYFHLADKLIRIERGKGCIQEYNGVSVA